MTPVANTFNFSSITTEEVIEALSQLYPKKAPGIDGISIRLLRNTIYVIAEPLANIFNLSLRTAIFPDDWKLAKISPIFKDGTKNDSGNYRPISVISTVAKLFEGIVYHQLRSFIAANNILIDQQSGFRPKHSTEIALISSINEWLLNMDKGFVNGVLFLDLKKAFDTVNHDILLSKLELCGIKGNSLDWLRSYLRNRKQACSVNGTISRQREIKCVVPQGSNLGPMLFLLYINDLLHCLKTTKTKLFADDTNLSCDGLTSPKYYSFCYDVNEFLSRINLTHTPPT